MIGFVLVIVGLCIICFCVGMLFQKERSDAEILARDVPLYPISINDVDTLTLLEELNRRKQQIEYETKEITKFLG